MRWPSFIKCSARGLGAGRPVANSGGLGNVRIFSQCAGSAFVISADVTSAKEPTQCLLVENGHLTTVANRQHLTKIVG